MRTRHVVILAFAAALAGCAAPQADDKSAMRQRQDAALKDPFSYGPSTPAANGKPLPPDTTPKRDDSAKGDWERFWNP